MKLHFLRSFGVGVALGAVWVASAFALSSDTNPTTLRMEAHRSMIRVEGNLTCKIAAAENNGEPCVLKIEENGTGKTFSLSNTRGAMELYREGKTSVAIEGRKHGVEAIEIASIAAH